MAEKKVYYWIGPGVVLTHEGSIGKGEPLPDAPLDKKAAAEWAKDLEQWKKAGLISAAAAVSTKGRPTKEVEALKKKVQKLETDKAKLAEQVKAEAGKAAAFDKLKEETDDTIAELEAAVATAEDEARQAKAELEALKSTQEATPEAK